MFALSNWFKTHKFELKFKPASKVYVKLLVPLFSNKLNIRSFSLEYPL